MEGRKSASGSLVRDRSFQPDTTLRKDEASPPRSIDLNRPLYEEQMIKMRYDRIMLQHNRYNSVGPNKKRYNGVRAASSSQSSNVRKKDFRTRIFPNFGSSLGRGESVYNGIWTGILRLIGETAHSSDNNNSNASEFRGISQGVRAFDEYAASRNPWLRNTMHFRETIAESNKRCERQHPYSRPNSPPPKSWDKMSSPTTSQGSCVDSCSEGNAEPEVQSDTQIEDGGNQPAQDRQQSLFEQMDGQQPLFKQMQVQNYGARQQNFQNSDEDNSKCKFCLGVMVVRDTINQSSCGHYFHLQCLVPFNRPIDPSFCFHCVWTRLHQD